jgi:hypothetical protein
MATTQYDIARKDEKWEITKSVGGAISDAVRVTVQDAEPRNELVMEVLEVLKQRLLEDDWAQN